MNTNILSMIAREVDRLEKIGEIIDHKNVAFRISNRVINAVIPKKQRDKPYVDALRGYTYEGVRDDVKDFLKSYFKEDEESVAAKRSTPLFPGYERLQAYYPIKRDEEEVCIPIMKMTDAEIDAKIAEYRAMGDGVYLHADELQRFKKFRKSEGVTVTERETNPVE